MKIDLKKRLKNKTFLISASVLIVSFIYSLLSLFDIIPDISQKEITDVIAMGVNILAFVGVLVDPTTEGISDKTENTEALEKQEKILDENTKIYTPKEDKNG